MNLSTQGINKQICYLDPGNWSKLYQTDYLFDSSTFTSSIYIEKQFFLIEKKTLSIDNMYSDKFLSLN